MDSVLSGLSFFTLGFPVLGVPMSLWRYHLYVVHDSGIYRVVTEVPTAWAGMDVSSRVLSHSLQSGIFVCCSNSEPSPLLGQGLALFFVLSVLISPCCCGGVSYGNILLWQRSEIVHCAFAPGEKGALDPGTAYTKALLCLTALPLSLLYGHEKSRLCFLPLHYIVTLGLKDNSSKAQNLCCWNLI